MAIVIQKQMRKYFASKLFEQEKRKENCFKNLAHNFKKNVKCPDNRQKFNLFKRDILSQLKEMEELLYVNKKKVNEMEPIIDNTIKFSDLKGFN